MPLNRWSKPWMFHLFCFVCVCVHLTFSLSPLYTTKFCEEHVEAANTKLLMPLSLSLSVTWWGNKQGPISCVSGLVCNKNTTKSSHL